MENKTSSSIEFLYKNISNHTCSDVFTILSHSTQSYPIDDLNLLRCISTNHHSHFFCITSIMIQDVQYQSTYDLPILCHGILYG